MSIGEATAQWMAVHAVHVQRGPGSSPARFLLVLVPAGFAQCFLDFAALLERRSRIRQPCSVCRPPLRCRPLPLAQRLL